MKYCTKCGSPIVSDTKFCTKCGNPIKNTDTNNEKIEEHKVNLLKKENDVIKSDIENSNNEMQFIQESVEEKNEHITEEQILREQYNKPKEGEYVTQEPVEPLNNKNGKEQNVSVSDSSVDSQFKNSGLKNKNSKNTFFSGIFPKIIIGVVLIIAILSGIFFNRIRGEYYIIKANDSVNITEKLEYSIKAVKVLNSSDTKDLLKNTLVEIAKSNVELAEQKLNEVSGMLSQGDFQNIAIGIKEKKIDKLYSDGKYQEAVAEFSEIDKLGGDFKSNKNYEDIMLNVISKITNAPLSNTKNLLMEDRQICFDNFDDDPFDEIIELKADSKYSYNSGIKLNLYKIKNGQYKLVDTQTIERAWDQKIQGVYNYSDNKKGVFVYYANASNNVGTSVFGVNNDKLQLKGAIFGNNYTKPDDVDNDGIYEVLSNSTSVVSSAQKDNSKWYKIYEDGRTPTEVIVNGGEKAQANSNSGDYIFKDSDKRYLTEEDVRGLSKDQLALARNEIFARHGYVFNEEKFKNYFTAKSWYVPNSSYDGSDSTLNQYEIANYKLIQAWEKK
jgi:hypothetical protein